MIFFWESLPSQVHTWVMQEIFDRSGCQTQKEFGKKIGKSRSHVTNMLHGTYRVTEKNILTVIRKLHLSQQEFEAIIHDKLDLFQDQQRVVNFQFVFTGDDMMNLEKKLQLDEATSQHFWQILQEKIGEFVPSKEVEEQYWKEHMHVFPKPNTIKKAKKASTA